MDPYKAVGITRSTPLWHGGAPGIAPGDYIEPEKVLTRRGIGFGARRYAHDNSVVYVSPQRDLARAFATRSEAFFSRGVLYRVQPTPASSLACDDDFRPEVSLTCARALVVAVEETDISMSDEDSTRIVGPHMEWTDRRPIYDEDGYMSPASNWPGADAEQVRSLGKWLPVDKVVFNHDTQQAQLLP